VSDVRGVGHPVKPLPDMRRPNARRCKIGGPDTIATCFQVSSYSGEPCTSSLARNLFSKDDWRAALFDKPSKSGPKVPLVSRAFSCSCHAEGLAGTTPGPALPFPAREFERVRPAPDAGEEVALLVSSEVVSPNIDD
jgi:hypothetical protein